MRIALLDDYQNVSLSFADWQRLPEGVTVTPFTEYVGDPARVAEMLAPFQVVMALRERTLFPGALLRQLPELRMLATAGMRNAAIDVPAATELGIVVCGTSGSGVPTMELTWALMQAVMRHLPREHGNMAAGRWQETVGVGLAGKTLGLVGLGRIGAQMVPVAKAFGMRVIAWSTNLGDERAAEVGVERVGKEDLLAQADVVSIHLQLSDRTRGLIGANDLARMKPTAYLINTSRGPIVDEDALVDVLRRKAIAGAGIDVYGTEPLPADAPIRTLDNVVLMPHMGYVTAEVYRDFYGQTLENVEAYLAGEPTRVLNPDVLPKLRPRATA